MGRKIQDRSNWEKNMEENLLIMSDNGRNGADFL